MKGEAMVYPTGYRYTKEHEWIRLDGKRARVGITGHAQAELGDIVFVELPAVGATVRKGDNVATVESVKAVGDVFSPASGSIVEVNTALEAAPETVNASPHEAGWIFDVMVDDLSDLDDTMDAAGYESLIAGK
jgi:glycine cleavage system H protein